MSSLHRLAILFVALLLSGTAFFAPEKVWSRSENPRERITSFDSWIQVEPSGLLKVVETISVVSRGDKIKRGIYRDFPTAYTNRSGVRFKVGFTVLDVQRDGQSEPYHMEKRNNGIRVYIGKSDVFLDPGQYTYTIIYQTDRQIGFFADYDELYWNVTGNGWEFPIEVASATLNLPREAIIQQHSVYTGSQGSTETDAETQIVSGSEIRFRTNKPLGPQEGLTIAAAWQKGIIDEPEFKGEAAYFMRDNRLVVVSAFGLIALLCYYILAWVIVGKDPEPEAIFPRFEPPKGYTPAAARYIMRMGFDNKAFASALVNLAVKKYLFIDNDQGTFTLKRSGQEQDNTLSSGEAKIADKLFAQSDTLRLKQSNHTEIRAAITALKKSLQVDFETLHFRRNSKYLLPGILITIPIIAFIFTSSEQKEIALFMSVWLTGWTAGCYALLVRIYNAWKIAWSEVSSPGDKATALFLSFFSIPFLGGWVAGFSFFVYEVSFAAVVALAFVLIVNFVFYHLLKAPTIMGRRVMDKLEGLKMYLSIAENDRLNILNPPEKTPELFEKLLPWAMALDVEQQWGEQFTGILVRAAQQGEYSPSWYTGPHHFTPASLATSLGSSLSATISSSSTAPGSSSGSGGGGSSGGGGGGGGGGGW